MPEDAGLDRHELRTVALRFQEAIPRTALLQVAATFPPLLALLAAMHVGLALGCWPVLALALPAAGLVVRVFALQHDCGHGSLFRSRRANDAVGLALLAVHPNALQPLAAVYRTRLSGQ